MPEQYPNYQQPYGGQNTGQQFNTGMTQEQQQQQRAYEEYRQRYQQQYGQIPAQPVQQQAQPVQTPQREIPAYNQDMKSKGKVPMVALLVVFGVVFIGAIVYFLLPEQQEVIREKEVREEAPRSVIIAPGQELVKKDVEIDELKFCTNLDTNFVCTEKEGNTLGLGESVYIYIRIRGFSHVKRDEGFLIGIKEDVETIDPEGISVYELSGTAQNLADFLSEEQNYLHLKNRLNIPDDLDEGAYTLRVNIMDKITGEEVSREKGFWIQ